MSSYLIENIILDYYDLPTTRTASNYVDIEITNLFLHIRNNINSNIYDPKGIQGNINHLTFEERLKIWNRANIDYTRANEARTFENNRDHRNAIKKWSDIFGLNFPSYY